eukprot:CAMPEP_0183367394 /NCGR_PEP_ID=MMETSP0164_2-20130417/92350_1 /TAXON_ID=221442 /ORGANISM="Coccolithus pelagicus ssp braarudi, Strain PLY182g" /LENGTH=135 /DNA_ID=CAMNT_0025543325 /DNA_START=202 /DNA_END=609 /DNA_ORIENTATION=+
MPLVSALLAKETGRGISQLVAVDFPRGCQLVTHMALCRAVFGLPDEPRVERPPPVGRVFSEPAACEDERVLAIAVVHEDVLLAKLQLQILERGVRHVARGWACSGAAREPLQQRLGEVLFAAEVDDVLDVKERAF